MSLEKKLNFDAMSEKEKDALSAAHFFWKEMSVEVACKYTLIDRKILLRLLSGAFLILDGGTMRVSPDAVAFLPRPTINLCSDFQNMYLNALYTALENDEKNFAVIAACLFRAVEMQVDIAEQDGSISDDELERYYKRAHYCAELLGLKQAGDYEQRLRLLREQQGT